MPDELEILCQLFILLYADDTIIMAENEPDFQRQLDILFDYCERNKLTVNSQKTKVMVFARSKARLKKMPIFKYGNENIEVVEDYTYLGIKFNWNGKFDKAKKELYKKGLKAMFAIIKKGRRLHLGMDIMLKLFDSCVVPVLLYGCEVWGFEETSLLDKVHSRFCKIMLKFTKYKRNAMVYGELGRFPQTPRPHNHIAELVQHMSQKVST